MKLKYLITPLLAVVLFAGCEKPAEPAAEKPKVTTPPAATPAPVVVEKAVEVTIQPEPVAPLVLPDPVAVVNGTPISKAEFEKTLTEIFASMGMQASTLPPEQRGTLYRQFAEDMVVDKLVDIASAKTEVTPSEIDAEMAKITQQYGSAERFAEELKTMGQTPAEFKDRLVKMIRQRKWMESQVKAGDQVTEAQIKAFYNENKAEFEQPQVVRASHILIRLDEGADPDTIAAKQKIAAALAERATKGEDFAKLATEFSEDPTAKQNAGDLNFFPKDRMVPAFAEVAFNQAVGTVSIPVRTQFGWHVIKVTDKKEAKTLPFDEVKNDIGEYLMEGKKQQAVEAVIRGLRENAKVEILIPEPAAPAIDVQMQGVDVVAPPK